MYIFLEKLTMDVLPRVKLHQEYTKDKYNEDLHSHLDQDGNYNIGVNDPFF
jgi:ribosomal protein L5